MNVYYRDIFSQEDCSSLADEMFFLMKTNQLLADYTPYTNGSLGAFNLRSTWAHVERIEEVIKKDYGDNIAFENTFTRIYQNSNDLKIHTDRPGLDITLSACLYSNLGWDWPIFISNKVINGPWNPDADTDEYKQDRQIFYTPVGSGVACLGTRNPHWRDQLTCEDHQCMIQTFYHWRYV